MERQDSPSAKWWQLAFGVLCMAMIANLQYGWTLFVDPIDAKFHWGRAAIQFAFTIFVATETWLVPVEAWFVDRYGPRIVVCFGGMMIALAWFLNAHADSLFLLYAAAVIGGIGAGSVYGTCVGNALKWFPHRRGLAAGATAAGFGAGAAVTVVPIAKMIATSGYQDAFLYLRPRSGGHRGRCCRSSCASRPWRCRSSARPCACPRPRSTARRARWCAPPSSG